MSVQIRRTVREGFVAYNGQLYLLALAAVCLAVQGLYLVAIPPATGFETSIYDPYPLTFWFAFGLCLALVIVVLAASVISSQSFYGRALAILAANYGILMFLPTFRGYQLHDRGTGDILVHLGHVRGIVSTGNVPDLWYPFEHVLMATFRIFGVPLEESAILFMWFFLLLFITTSGFFIRSFTRQRFALAVGTAAAIPILFTSTIMSSQPSIFSILLFPALVTFADRLRRTVDKRYLALLCLTVFAIVPFHPMTSLLVMVLLFATMAIGYVYGRWEGRRIRTASGSVALATIPVIFIWYADFGKTWHMLNEMIMRILAGAPSAVEDSTREAAILTVTQTAIRFVHLYGAIFLYLIVAASATMLIAYRLSSLRYTYQELYLSVQFGIGFIIAALLLRFHISMAPIRNSRYMIVISIFIMALAIIWSVLSDNRGRTIVATSLVTLIIVSGILASAAVYQPSNHMTKSEFAGADHTIEYHDASIDVYSLNMADNVNQYVRSTQSSEIRPPHFVISEKEIPFRLGYAENETAAETYGDAYVVTKEFDTEFYTASYFFPQQQEILFVYDESDKEKIRLDTTADRLYDNGGFEGWRVNASTERDP